MTNFEHYKDFFLEVLKEKGWVNVGLAEGCPRKCSELPCEECELNNKDGKWLCSTKIAEWLQEEYKKPKVDWTKVAVDTKVLVKDYENGQWFPEHFARYDEKTNKVFVFRSGGTSWTTTRVDSWDRVKLAEESEEYKEPEVEELKVDWSKVPVDTKILVKCCDTDDWERRYFAKYDKETNEVYSFVEGATSWSSGSNPVLARWDYVKLVGENKE